MPLPRSRRSWSDRIVSPAAYTFDDLVAAYAEVGVAAARVVVVCGDFGRLMAFEKPGKDAVLKAHLDALLHLLGPEGTLVVPTHSMNLLGTDIPFDPATTPSWRAGALSEYVRTQPGATRSFHPYVSYAALGPRAAAITEDVTRHVYGPETPEARLIDMDALHVGVGMPVRVTQATIHHIEQLMAVPYRYTREYLHPVVRAGAVRVEPFYMFVRYLSSGVQRNYNKRIFEAFEQRHTIRRAPLGRSEIASYEMRALYDHAIEMFKHNIFVWAEAPPPKPVYRQAI